MANMSYCRFQNTLSDLRDCSTAFEDMLHGMARPLSQDEQEAAAKLLEECANLLAMAGEAMDYEFTAVDRKDCDLQDAPWEQAVQAAQDSADVDYREE